MAPYGSVRLKHCDSVQSIYELTGRQFQVLELRCGSRELTIAGVAQEMNITPHTVKNHGTDILRRLGVQSFNGACREYGRETGVPGLRPGEV